jgi:nucleoside-diphosphate-sugar epimerase
MMRVLVTGASGHVGGAIARHLVEVGDEVFGLSRRPGRIAGLAGALELDLGSETAAEQVARQVPACAAIVHAAASLEKQLDAPAIALVNVLGTQQMVRLAQRWDTAQIVFISGVPVIGRPQDLPVTEEHPTDPPTAYHASKLFGETLMQLAGRRGQSTVSLRLTSPVGPGMPADRILSVFVRRALEGEPLLLAGRGTRRQDYVDVRDVAAAVASCLRERVSGLFNIAAGASTSNLELAEKCRCLPGSSSAIHFTGVDDPDEGVNWDVSITEASRRFGYRPQFSLDQSIHAVAADHARRVAR